MEKSSNINHHCDNKIEYVRMCVVLSVDACCYNSLVEVR